MTLYHAYREERNSGKTHAQIVSDGVFGSLAEEFALKYSEEIAVYVDAMNKRANCEGDLDIFGRPMREGT